MVSFLESLQFDAYTLIVESDSPLLDDPYSLLIPGFLDISRREKRDVKMRHVRVVLDGKLLGQLAYGESRRFPIRPGRHELIVTNTLNKSIETFEIKSGECVSFSCAQTASDLSLALFVFLGAGNMPVHLKKLTE